MLSFSVYANPRRFIQGAYSSPDDTFVKGKFPVLGSTNICQTADAMCQAQAKFQCIVTLVLGDRCQFFQRLHT